MEKKQYTFQEALEITKKEPGLVLQHGFEKLTYLDHYSGWWCYRDVSDKHTFLADYEAYEEEE